LERIGKTAVDLVVADETLGDMTGLDLIKRLVAINPLINCAAVSSLSKEAYHEASEGLGILMQLPPKPAGADGQRLMAHLNQILGLSSQKKISSRRIHEKRTQRHRHYGQNAGTQPG
jgi:two-component SAPR family response regulator